MIDAEQISGYCIDFAMTKQQRLHRSSFRIRDKLDVIMIPELVLTLPKVYIIIGSLRFHF